MELSDPILGYGVSERRRGHSWYGIASVCVSGCVICLTLGVVALQVGRVDVDGFMANVKQVRIGVAASLLAGILAWAARRDKKRKQILSDVGFVLSALALLAVAICLPEM